TLKKLTRKKWKNWEAADPNLRGRPTNRQEAIQRQSLIHAVHGFLLHPQTPNLFALCARIKSRNTCDLTLCHAGCPLFVRSQTGVGASSRLTSSCNSFCTRPFATNTAATVIPNAAA